MKISELITILQQVQTIAGDLEVETPWEGQEDRFPQPSDVYVSPRGTLVIDADN